MSNQMYEKLQTSWPMLIGGKANKFRQELLELYEQEQQTQAQAQQQHREQVVTLEASVAQLEAEVAKLQQDLTTQQETHQREYANLHEQVLHKIRLMEEQAELYFVKNAENEVK